MKTFIVHTTLGKFLTTAFDQTQAVFKIRKAYDLHWSEVIFTENFSL